MFNVFEKIKKYFSENKNNDDHIKRVVSYKEYKDLLKTGNDLDKIEEVKIMFSSTEPGKGKVELTLEKPENYTENETRRVVHKDKPINMRQPSYKENDRG